MKLYLHKCNNTALIRCVDRDGHGLVFAPKQDHNIVSAVIPCLEGAYDHDSAHHATIMLY